MPSIALKALTEATQLEGERARKREGRRQCSLLCALQAVRRAEGDELVDDTTILLIHFREG